MRLLSRHLPVLQGMYLLLVTNKASNILEDLETLRLMSKVLPEYVLPPVDEESIIGAAFELLFAFDEVISLGYKENVTVAQVKQNTEMESHEEKLHKMIIQSKVQDTKVRRSCSCVRFLCESLAALLKGSQAVLLHAPKSLTEGALMSIEEGPSPSSSLLVRAAGAHWGSSSPRGGVARHASECAGCHEAEGDGDREEQD